MRLDLFLKWSRVIIRRSLAKETCDAGRVKVNDVESRPGREVRIGDIVAIDFPRRGFKFKIRSIPAHSPSKEGSHEMIEILEDFRKE